MSTASFETAGEGRYRVAGVLDATTVPLLLRESEARIANTSSSAVEIDLSGVTESDSAGLALLLEWLRLAKQRNAKVKFENVPTQVLALARISEVEALILPSAAASQA